MTLVMPNLPTKNSGGRLESSIPSDDKKYRVLTIRTDVPVKRTTAVVVKTE